LQGAKDAVIAFKDGIVSAMTALADDIVAVFRELPAKMVQVGADIIEGLRNGINAKIQSVKDSINNAAQGMVDGVKGIFGIQSPSKVFRQIGVFLMEGLGQGVESGAGDVRNSLDDFSTDIASSFKGAFKGMLLEGKSFASSMGGILSSIGGRMVDTGLNSLFSGFKIPGFAMGTNFAPGGVAMVGEKGPELVNLPRGSQVIPNKNLGGGIADVRVSVDQNGNLQAFVERVSSGVTRQGISAYDRSMPGRVQSIQRDPRAR
jgi:phage-related protein